MSIDPEKLADMYKAHLDGVYKFSARDNCDELVTQLIHLYIDQGNHLAAKAKEQSDGLTLLSIEAIDAAQVAYQQYIGPDKQVDLALMATIIKTYARVERKETEATKEQPDELFDKWAANRPALETHAARAEARYIWDAALATKRESGIDTTAKKIVDSNNE